MADKLSRYKQKRDFTKTAEPSGSAAVGPSDALRFVIQKHDATHLHFDLRLEFDGTFRSWAVPKGPSLDPKDRRLAMEVEDHPLDYGDFEGTIPEGEYGGGTVMLWDRGLWAPESGFEDIGKSLSKGELKFVMEGGRMHGGWVLVRTKTDQRGKSSWILIKHRDAAAETGNTNGPTDDDRSIASGRTMAQIEKGSGKAPTPFMKTATRPADAVWAKTKKPEPSPEKPATKKRTTHSKYDVSRGTTKVSEMPSFIEPQLTKPVDSPSASADWAHEIKFDGYRMQARIEDGKAVLRTRKGLDWSAKFPEITKACGALPDGIIDGEIVALDEADAPDFAALQAAISDERTDGLVFFIFDLMFERKSDLREMPLSDRKERLKPFLGSDHGPIRFVEHFTSGGAAILQSACKLHLEGIISKRLDSPYQSGRPGTWTKSKCRGGQEVVLAGYATNAGKFRSLLAGVFRNERFVYVGRIGTGYSKAVVERLLPELQSVETSTCPFDRAPPDSRKVQWLKPVLVAEIECEGFTAEGQLRQAAFKGLRADKPAAEVGLEKPDKAEPPASETPSAPVTLRGSASVMGVMISKAEKPLWSTDIKGDPVTKLELAQYLEKVGPWMIEHLKGRPCSIIRFPDGIEKGDPFFQRHAGEKQSALINQIKIADDRKPYLQFDSVEALIAGAQSAALEFHPWNCQPNKLDRPGRLIFDLDPAPDVPFEDVIEAAQEVRDRLQAIGLNAFCKTTGGKGLHVVTPLKDETIAWDVAKTFALYFCEAMAADSPKRFLVNMAKKQRAGRIYLDYLRNDRKSTAVAPMSPRGRPGALVSMPLTWREVKRGLNPSQYDIRSAGLALLTIKPWQDYCDAERSLKSAIKRFRA